MFGKTRILFYVFCSVLAMGLFPDPALYGKTPAVGSDIPQFQLKALESDKEIEYLGANTSKPFTLKDLDCRLTLVEIIGIYCPQCHIQHPIFNKLFHRIKKDPDLSKKVKMISIAAGGNTTETAYVKKKYAIKFPIIADKKFEIHKLLGKPRTPFTMLVTKEGKIVFAHLGVIKDMDKFMEKIKQLSQ